MEQLNACVVGGGDLGTVHTEQWQKLPGAEVVAICEIDEARGLAAQEKFGIGAVYTDYREAFAHPDIDAVSVAIPSGVHRIVSEAAMRRGYHVLCEKPIAVTREDGQAMVTAAQECGVEFASDDVGSLSLSWGLPPGDWRGQTGAAGGEDGMIALQVSLAALRSIETGHAVVL